MAMASRPCSDVTGTPYCKFKLINGFILKTTNRSFKKM
jgi:hypothetical protein